MSFESINPPQFPTPIAPYSAGTKAGNKGADAAIAAIELANLYAKMGK